MALSKRALEYKAEALAMSEHDRIAGAVKADRQAKTADDRRRGFNAAVCEDIRTRGLLVGCVRDGNTWSGMCGSFKVSASLNVPGSGVDVKAFTEADRTAYEALPWHSWVADRVVFRKR